MCGRSGKRLISGLGTVSTASLLGGQDCSPFGKCFRVRTKTRIKITAISMRAIFLFLDDNSLPLCRCRRRYRGRDGARPSIDAYLRESGLTSVGGRITPQDKTLTSSSGGPCFVMAAVDAGATPPIEGIPPISEIDCKTIQPFAHPNRLTDSRHQDTFFDFPGQFLPMITGLSRTSCTLNRFPISGPSSLSILSLNSMNCLFGFELSIESATPQ